MLLRITFTRLNHRKSYHLLTGIFFCKHIFIRFSLVLTACDEIRTIYDSVLGFLEFYTSALLVLTLIAVKRLYSTYCCLCLHGLDKFYTLNLFFLMLVGRPSSCSSSS